MQTIGCHLSQLLWLWLCYYLILALYRPHHPPFHVSPHLPFPPPSPPLRSLPHPPPSPLLTSPSPSLPSAPPLHSMRTILPMISYGIDSIGSKAAVVTIAPMLCLVSYMSYETNSPWQQPKCCMSTRILTNLSSWCVYVHMCLCVHVCVCVCCVNLQTVARVAAYVMSANEVMLSEELMIAGEGARVLCVCTFVCVCV